MQSLGLSYSAEKKEKFVERVNYRVIVVGQWVGHVERVVDLADTRGQRRRRRRVQWVARRGRRHRVAVQRLGTWVKRRSVRTVAVFGRTAARNPKQTKQSNFIQFLPLERLFIRLQTNNTLPSFSLFFPISCQVTSSSAASMDITLFHLPLNLNEFSKFKISDKIYDET